MPTDPVVSVSSRFFVSPESSTDKRWSRRSRSRDWRWIRRCWWRSNWSAVASAPSAARAFAPRNRRHRSPYSTYNMNTNKQTNKQTMEWNTKPTGPKYAVFEHENVSSRCRPKFRRSESPIRRRSSDETVEWGSVAASSLGNWIALNLALDDGTMGAFL